jgi:hypothetical protein
MTWRRPGTRVCALSRGLSISSGVYGLHATGTAYARRWQNGFATHPWRWNGWNPASQLYTVSWMLAM